MANTDFKIDDYLSQYPVNQYDFTFPAAWAPTNEQDTANMKIDRNSYPYINLNWFADYGLGDRPITLQGKDISDSDRFDLRCSIENPRIKKLFLGDDYYYYVRGLEARLMRDVNDPLLYSYTASFIAVDHYMYDNDALDSCQIDASDDLLIDTAGAILGGSTYVEPIFWVDALNAQALTFTDERGCSLTFTPASDNVWIVMPWYNYHVSSFHPIHPVAFEYQKDVADPGSNYISDYSSVWAMDRPLEVAAPHFLKTTGNYIIPDLGDTKGIYGNTSRYPRAEAGKKTDIAVTGEGGETGVYAQWRLRR